MKPLPPPEVPGNTEHDRFHNALRQVLSVSNEDLQKKEAEEKRRRERKKRVKKS